MVGVVALVDRLEGGADAIRAASLPLVCIANRRDFIPIRAISPHREGSCSLIRMARIASLVGCLGSSCRSGRGEPIPKSRRNTIKRRFPRHSKKRRASQRPNGPKGGFAARSSSPLPAQERVRAGHQHRHHGVRRQAEERLASRLDAAPQFGYEPLRWLAGFRGGDIAFTSTRYIEPSR